MDRNNLFHVREARYLEAQHRPAVHHGEVAS